MVDILALRLRHFDSILSGSVGWLSQSTILNDLLICTFSKLTFWLLLLSLVNLFWEILAPYPLNDLPSQDWNMKQWHIIIMILCNVTCRLAKIDLVTFFNCDYRWYCTIDYVIVNYIGIHHLFYHIQWFFSH